MDWLNVPVREALVLITVVVGLWAGKRLVPWLIREITSAVLDEIGDRLEPRWQSSIGDALRPIHAALDELRPNGGASIKDQISDMHRTIGEVARSVETLHTSPPRYTPPEGTPEGF